jgi:hypothetical protein
MCARFASGENWHRPERLVVVVLMAILAAACGSSSAISTAPSAQKCAVSVSTPAAVLD